MPGRPHGVNSCGSLSHLPLTHTISMFFLRVSFMARGGEVEEKGGGGGVGLGPPVWAWVCVPPSCVKQNMVHWKATKVDKGVQCYLGSGTTSTLPSARGDGVIPFPARCVIF
jgi:hypothetical protein